MITSFNYFNYYKIPFQFQYVFLKNRLNPTFGARLNAIIGNKTPFLLFPALNAGLNLSFTSKIYMTLNAEIDYFGKYYFIPTKSTSLVSNSFTFGLTIKFGF